MDANDPRVKRTENLLLTALLALSRERSYDQITIKDITEQANIAYATFFRHYRDKDELLLHTVNNAVATLMSLVRQLPDHTPEEEGRLLFRHVQDNADFYRLMLSENGTFRVLRQIQPQIEQILMDVYRVHGTPALPLEILAHHIFASVLELIRWWLEHDQTYAVEQMGQIYRRIIVEAAENAAFGRSIR